MFDRMERTVVTFQIEAGNQGFLFRANFQPLGALPTFMNDRRRRYVRFDEVELLPLAEDRQLQGVKQEAMMVNKDHLAFVSVLSTEQAQQVQVIAATRPVVFYLDGFTVQGKLHINVDANDEDLLDDARDFYPVSEAVVHPVLSMAAQPTRQVPLLLVNRPLVQAYHTLQE